MCFERIERQLRDTTFGASFNSLKAAYTLIIPGAQRVLGVDAEMARIIAHREQTVADIIRSRIGAGGGRTVVPLLRYPHARALRLAPAAPAPPPPHSPLTHP